VAVEAETLEAIAKSVAEATAAALSIQNSVAANQKNNCEFCGNEEQIHRHRDEHDFVRSLIKLFDRLESAKWGIWTAVVKSLLVAAFIGAIIFAWKTGVKGPPVP